MVLLLQYCFDLGNSSILDHPPAVHDRMCISRFQALITCSVDNVAERGQVWFSAPTAHAYSCRSATGSTPQPSYACRLTPDCFGCSYTKQFKDYLGRHTILTMEDIDSRGAPSAQHGSQRFIYDQLDYLESEIRLLKIETPKSTKPQNTSQLSFFIKHFTLQSAPPYKAVSYRWGDSLASREILVNGSPLKISDNLFDFFRKAGWESKSRNRTTGG